MHNMENRMDHFQAEAASAASACLLCSTKAMGKLLWHFTKIHIYVDGRLTGRKKVDTMKTT